MVTVSTLLRKREMPAFDGRRDLQLAVAPASLIRSIFDVAYRAGAVRVEPAVDPQQRGCRGRRSVVPPPDVTKRPVRLRPQRLEGTGAPAGDHGVIPGSAETGM
jgi:hypothetical protein